MTETSEFLKSHIRAWFGGASAPEIREVRLADPSESGGVEDLRSIARVALGRETQKETETLEGWGAAPLDRLRALVADGLESDGLRPLFDVLVARPWILDESFESGAWAVVWADGSEDEFHLARARDLTFVSDLDHVAFCLWVGDVPHLV